MRNLRNYPLPVHDWWVNAITRADQRFLRGLRIAHEVSEHIFRCAACGGVGYRECQGGEE